MHTTAQTGVETVIVTGAASGIGRATTGALLDAGWQVAAVDRDAEGLAKLRADTGRPQLHTIAADLRDATDITGSVEEVLGWSGRLDALVNNAGIGVAARLGDTSDADWDAILDVNLTAMFRLTRAALPALLATGAGRVVNVASVAAIVGVGNRAAYCASKAGVLGLTRSLAVDYARDGLRANAICPGTVDTEWIGKILDGAPDPAGTRARMESRQLDGRMGSPQEVAAGICFLLTPAARFVNGSAFVMDGGMTAV